MFEIFQKLFAKVQNLTLTPSGRKVSTQDDHSVEGKYLWVES
jgi:hypothetical protein